MTSSRLVSVLGLGFGDCGKGLFTDYLARRWQAHTVVRFNGGAQAGHNVVLGDGRHHTFSQFSSGTFISGVVTALASPVVVHPSALLVERDYLQAQGVSDALERLMIDARCRINTPFHQAAGRLRELLRGEAAHGTCGVGVGETVGHALAHEDEVLRYADLTNPIRALEKLEATRRSLLSEFANSFDIDPAKRVGAAQEEYSLLCDAGVAQRWLETIAELTCTVRAVSPDEMAAQIGQSGTALFEGAQGVLLDEWYGFHPHTTWSSTHAAAVNAVVAEAALTTPVRHLGVLRSYLTRHGQGPLPTQDADLHQLAEPHNASDGWQGRFRRGHPDAVLLRYAINAAGPLDGLLMTHLDVFAKGGSLKWCSSYEVTPEDGDGEICIRDELSPVRVTGLRVAKTPDLAHQTALTSLLSRATPQYDTNEIHAAESSIALVEHIAGHTVLAGSFGNRADAVNAFSVELDA